MAETDNWINPIINNNNNNNDIGNSERQRRRNHHDPDDDNAMNRKNGGKRQVSSDRGTTHDHKSGAGSETVFLLQEACGSANKDVWEPIFSKLPAPYGPRRQDNKLIFAIATLVLFILCLYTILISYPNLKSKQMVQIQRDQNDRQWAFKESNGFFNDIPSNVWSTKKERFRNQPRHNDAKLGLRSKFEDRDVPQIWYQNNWDPTFTCPHEVRVGGTGDGGKWICDPHRIPDILAAQGESGGCLIYSVGENTLISLAFETELYQMLGQDCEIHIFDHTLAANPTRLEKSKNLLPDKIHIHPWGLEAEEHASQGRRDYLTLKESVAKLGHVGKTLEIFKLDCQACEWSTYKEWFTSGLASIRQILVELHGTPRNDDKFFEIMEEQNYVIFHKEADTQYGGIWQEYSFLRLNPSFFKVNDDPNI